MKVTFDTVDAVRNDQTIYLYHSKLAEGISGSYLAKDTYEFTCACTARPEIAQGKQEVRAGSNCCAYPDKTLVATMLGHEYKMLQARQDIKAKNYGTPRGHNMISMIMDGVLPPENSVTVLDKHPGMTYSPTHIYDDFMNTIPERKARGLDQYSESKSNAPSLRELSENQPNSKRSLFQRALDLLNHLRK